MVQDIARGNPSPSPTRPRRHAEIPGPLRGDRLSDHGAGKKRRVSRNGRRRSNRGPGAREEFALIYFSSAGCPYCAEEGSILAVTSQKYGWDIRRSMRKGSLRSPPSSESRRLPTLLLVNRGSSRSYHRPSAGVASLAEIEEKLYRWNPAPQERRSRLRSTPYTSSSGEAPST